MNELNDDLIEALAELEHDRWVRWQRHLHSLCEPMSDGALVIPAARVERWAHQIATGYHDLQEHEKESDRKEAHRTILVLTEHRQALRELVEG